MIENSRSWRWLLRNRNGVSTWYNSTVQKTFEVVSKNRLCKHPGFFAGTEFARKIPKELGFSFMFLFCDPSVGVKSVNDPAVCEEGIFSHPARAVSIRTFKIDEYIIPRETVPSLFKRHNGFLARLRAEALHLFLSVLTKRSFSFVDL